MRFEFATATRIIFGLGSIREIGPIASSLITEAAHARILVVCGRTIERARPLLSRLEGQKLSCEAFAIDGEPTIAIAQAGRDRARAIGGSLVIGFGGGSAIDAGKAIAALATNDGDPLDYLEVVGRGRPLERAPLPYIAIPTTAGTGAEVTRNAVLASPEHQVKVSLRSPLMLPKVALIDPELTYDLPPQITASTGMDALTQLIEPFISTRANPMTDAICREGIRLAARSLERACRNGRDASAREDMCVASLFGGLALANAGLGAVHGFAGPIGGMFPAPHGAVCAALLPHVLATNVRALRERSPESPALHKLNELSRLLTGHPQATPDDAASWTSRLCAELQIPSLSSYGLTRADLPRLVQAAQAASSMKANPIVLTPDELTAILEGAM